MSSLNLLPSNMEDGIFILRLSHDIIFASFLVDPGVFFVLHEFSHIICMYVKKRLWRCTAWFLFCSRHFCQRLLFSYTPTKQENGLLAHEIRLLPWCVWVFTGRRNARFSIVQSGKTRRNTRVMLLAMLRLSESLLSISWLATFVNNHVL